MEWLLGLVAIETRIFSVIGGVGMIGLLFTCVRFRIGATMAVHDDV